MAPTSGVPGKCLITCIVCPAFANTWLITFSLFCLFVQKVLGKRKWSEVILKKTIWSDIRKQILAKEILEHWAKNWLQFWHTKRDCSLQGPSPHAYFEKQERIPSVLSKSGFYLPGGRDLKWIVFFCHDTFSYAILRVPGGGVRDGSEFPQKILSTVNGTKGNVRLLGKLRVLAKGPTVIPNPFP